MTDREYAKMCVGAGWHSLVDEAFDYFEEQAIEVIQIKEKFGQLRIYVTSASDEMYISENVYAKIAEIEGRSGRMCECCGQPAEPRTKGGWIKTICIPCEKMNDVLAKT